MRCMVDVAIESEGGKSEGGESEGDGDDVE